MYDYQKVLFIYILFSCSCTNDFQITKKEKEINHCIQEFGLCNDIVHSRTKENSRYASFLQGKWLNRQMKYHSADTTFQQLHSLLINKYIPNSILVDYTITYSINNRRLRKPSINLINHTLSIRNLSNHQIVELLTEKAACLRDLLQNEYALSCLTYALQIDQNDNFAKCNLHFTTSVEHIREARYNQAQHHLKEAIQICSVEKFPICKYIYSLGQQEGVLTMIERSLLTNKINKSTFSPWIDKYTNTTDAFNSNDVDSTIFFLKKNINSDLAIHCLEDAIDLIYLIDTYIKIGDFTKAEKYIESYLECCRTKSIDADYRIYKSLSSLYSNKYIKNNNENSLHKAITANTNEIKISKLQLSKSDNLHYADLRLDNLTDLLNIFLLNEDLLQDNKYKELLHSRLTEYKKHTLNLTQTTYNLFNQEDNNILTQYLDLSATIDSLSLLSSQKHVPTDIFRKKYDAHLKLYNLTQSIKINESIDSSEKSNLQTDSISNQIFYGTDQIIELVRGYEKYYVIHFTPTDIRLKTIDSEILDNQIEELLQLIKTKGNLESIESTSTSIRNSMNIDYNNNKSLIIPEGKLSDLPFEALLPTHTNTSEMSYSLTHSISLKDKFTTPTNVAIMSYSDQNTINSREALDIPELPHSLIEIKAISDIYLNNSVYEGSMMTKSRISNNLKANILHISTHSFSDPENLLGNYLIVRDNNGEPEKMYGYQIKNSICTADLVVLSSCNSGTGTYKPGAGTFSLSRDFLAAGAKSVIKSLWNVNEASTAELMISFHTYFQDHSVSKALTLAKRDMANSKKYSHPYYWAGFVLEGNPNIYLSKE